MALYLVEIRVNSTTEDELTDVLHNLSNKIDGDGQLIEAQIGLEEGRAYIVVDSEHEKRVESAISDIGLEALNIKEVLLVGQDLDRVKERSANANYLVEWNLPEGLTMERYLERKKEKSPLYAEVPEVSFERTYVCTDMSKCLCFYESPDVESVKKARAVVEAPIDKLTSVKKAGV